MINSFIILIIFDVIFFYLRKTKAGNTDYWKFGFDISWISFILIWRRAKMGERFRAWVFKGAPYIFLHIAAMIMTIFISVKLSSSPNLLHTNITCVYDDLIQGCNIQNTIPLHQLCTSFIVSTTLSLAFVIQLSIYRYFLDEQMEQEHKALTQYGVGVDLYVQSILRINFNCDLLMSCLIYSGLSKSELKITTIVICFLMKYLT